MKKKIRLELAQQWLLEFNDEALWEQFMEMLHEFFMHNVAGILTAHDVIHDDGSVFTETDDEQWYDDEIREEFFDRCYQRLVNDIYANWGIKAEEV